MHFEVKNKIDRVGWQSWPDYSKNSLVYNRKKHGYLFERQAEMLIAIAVTKTK